jgi:hypothetical protein
MINKRIIMNRIYALDVEVFLAQKQDLMLYFSNVKGIRPKMNKPEIERHFLDRDLKVTKDLFFEDTDEIDENLTLSTSEFTKFINIQLERFSRMVGF